MTVGQHDPGTPSVETSSSQVTLGSVKVTIKTNWGRMADGPPNTEGGGNGEYGTEMREVNPETLGEGGQGMGDDYLGKSLYLWYVRQRPGFVTEERKAGHPDSQRSCLFSEENLEKKQIWWA